MDKFKLDDEEVNTDLAKEYIQKNNKSGDCEPVEERGQSSSKDSQQAQFGQDEPFRKLAEEIEKNAETFCQIEYLKRKIPAKQVKDYDIKLIVKLLSCTPREIAEGFSPEVSSTILMDDSTPLAALGLIAPVASRCWATAVVATRDTYDVCRLFVDLCRKVGLTMVELIMEPSPNPKSLISLSKDSSPGAWAGCAGVVCERADVDSAVDTFLNAATRYPWKLSRILVQESVYDSFQKAFAWKANLKPENTSETAPHGTKAFTYDGKTFLIDYAGDPETVPGIPISAYRTTKELLSLLKSGELFMSLWTGDVSVANEIAYNVQSPFVWINSYGVFDGPPQVARAIYTEFIRSITKSSRYLVTDRGSFLKKREIWSKMSFEERRNTILNMTDDFAAGLTKEQPLFVEEVKVALRDLKSNNFVQIDRDRMCVGVQMPGDVFFVGTLRKCVIRESGAGEFVSSMTLLAEGSALIFVDDKIDNEHYDYLRLLSAAMPITFSEGSGEEVAATNNFAMHTKVVWTDFGTIFAN